jgi:hypothetical protein
MEKRHAILFCEGAGDGSLKALPPPMRGKRLWRKLSQITIC